MPLKIGKGDGLEMMYKPKFKAIAAHAGFGIEYEYDRAALDWGLHITEHQQGDLLPTQTRVWFQFKGISKEKLPLADIQQVNSISIPVHLDHLHQWYRGQEATYLAVYVESIGTFFAQDVADIVAQLGGEAVLRKVQESITIKMPVSACIDDAFWERLRQHRSMRTDMASFRGVPLPHRRDPHSSILNKMEPSTFTRVVEALLAAHRYQFNEPFDVAPMYPSALAAGDIISGSFGVLYDPYEWSPQLTNELLPDHDGLYQEGQILRSHGRCAVVIHSHVASRPDVVALTTFIHTLQQRRIDNLLVFVNHYMYTSLAGNPFNCFPEYSQASVAAKIECMPQHLEDVARSILIRPNVYLPFADKISFWGDDVLLRIQSV